MRFWKHIDVCSFISIWTYKQNLDENSSFEVIREGYGLITETKETLLGDLLFPGETRLNLLLEKKNVQDRWAWTGEGQPGAPNQNQRPQYFATQHRVSTSHFPTYDDEDEDIKRAIALSLAEVS
jgi:hypothetical protein